MAKAKSTKTETSTAPDVPKRYIVWRTFPDGTLADMVYSQSTDIAEFVVASEGKFTTQSELWVGTDGNLTFQEKGAVLRLLPSWMLKDHVRKNFIHIASRPEAYGSTAELHRDIRALIQKYVVLEDVRFYDVAAGYVLMTWVFDRFNTVPYLRVVGDLGTGKSRFLEVVGKLCNRAMMASSISPAAIYRTLDQVESTLVYDEADFKSSDMTDDIVKLLNSGHRKGAPVVKMEVSDDKIRTVTFRVFGPKILGSRQSFTDTALESRCITQRLFPLKKTSVAVHLPPSFDAEAQTLRNKLLMFRLRNFHHVHEDESSLGGLEFPRMKQTALALTSVVKMVGEEVLAPVLEFLKDSEKTLLDSVSTDTYADVLLCIARLIEFDEEVRKSGQLYMGTIAAEFNKMFYGDYAERETREISTREGLLVIPGQLVSPKKIGGYVDKLGLRKARDGGGVYIPLGKEGPKVMSLIERRGLQDILTKLREEAAEKKRNPKKVPWSTASDFVKDTLEPSKD
ncbi:MAG: hypothetical protein AAB480_02630 [Patescibacteria group bacterium]